MLSQPEFEKLDKMFHAKLWQKGATIEDMAFNAGERKVIDKLRVMVNTQGFVKDD